MDFYILSYRALRLRRLIGVSIALPTVLVLLIAAFAGSPWLLFLPLTVGLPAAHALRYPTEWVETLTVSVVLTLSIMLFAIVTSFVGPLADLMVLLLMGPIGLAAVLWLSERVPELLAEGPVDTVERKARARTRLSIAELRETIALRPGYRDARTHCSQADERGIFTITHRRAVVTVRGEEVVTEPVQFRAKLEEDTETAHEVRGVTAKGHERSVLRTSFQPLVRGTLVTVHEITEPKTLGQALGLWLTDSLADYLTDTLDRASGLRMRAFRCLPADGLRDELTRRFAMRRTSGQDTAPQG